MSGVDAVRCFLQVLSDFDSGLASVIRPPSVKWIVVAEPLVCPVCVGLGRYRYENQDIDCLDCNGTGIPDVEIQSRCRDAQCGCGETGFIIHGVVTVGVAVPIVFNWNDWMVMPVVSVEQTGDVVLVRNRIDGFCEEVTDITDEFGSQVITPGMWAHPIAVTPENGRTPEQPARGFTDERPTTVERTV